jgi:CO/xanthine dehydrogenase FAD-binding subunit
MALTPLSLASHSFVLAQPCSPEDVDNILASDPLEAKLLAGGTDLLVQIRGNAIAPKTVVDLSQVSGLDGIVESQDGPVINAATTLRALEEEATICTRYQALVDAGRTVGSPQIQNVATLVGNACNASPAADTPVALLIFDATFTIRGAAGSRQVVARDFWLGPRRTCLQPGEWVAAVRLPRTGDAMASSYLRVGRTRGVDLAIAGMACAITAGEIRIACTGVAPTPKRLTHVESAFAAGGLREPNWRAITTALNEEIDPITDIRGTNSYKRAIAAVCLQRAYDQTVTRIGRKNTNRQGGSDEL